MTTVYWHPSWTTDLLRRQLDQVFGEVTDAFAKERIEKMSSTDETKIHWYPAIELIDMPEAFQLRVVLPAVMSDRLELQACRYGIMLSGTRPAPELDEEQRVLISEFTYGEFRRMVELPAEIHPDQVKADFRDGLLVVNLPKADLQHRVKVRVNSPAKTDQPALKVSHEEVTCT